MTKIKICGLTTIDDIKAVNAYCPDYIGFVFAPGRRHVTPEQALALKQALLPQIRSVGVFVNAGIGEIAELAAHGIIDLIQLHGDETPADLRALRALTDIPVIKAIRVRNAEDIRTARNWQSDYLLFDTYTKGAYGGSGLTFDWSLIPPMEKPYFLAGGLSVSNMEQAARTPAFCLDISSGVETHGRKDPDKIKQVINTIKNRRS